MNELIAFLLVAGCIVGLMFGLAASLDAHQESKR